MTPQKRRQRPVKKKKGRYGVAELKTLGNQLLPTFVSPSSPPHHVLESLLSLHSFFLPLLPKLSSHSAFATPSVVGDQSEFSYLSWLRSKFDEFLKSLLDVLTLPQGDETLKELVLDTLMEFVKVANGGALHSSLYHKLLHSIVYSTSPPTFLVDLLASKYVKYIDVQYGYYACYLCSFNHQVFNVTLKFFGIITVYGIYCIVLLLAPFLEG
ncbi:hypothetical protein JHK82_024903 [Glycine max]|uniref:CCAAT-binding factor domain-containing protein n=1 Tax=Glycine max TaxID=3847 RepID=A0A0R0IDE8_SOYBN|nr:hypothetical protein JHK86_025022 [Glycine max]KAG5133715.1 hypothetical protein JHK82_024903 [Glycine max]KAH1042722.1 hypothetical protein GYH30_024842 [Glycine max]